jgi:putative hydrolase of the HAD superfamily
MLTKEEFKSNVAPLTPQPTNIQPGGTLNHKIECVLFDVYGTLLISASGDIGVAKKKESEKTWKLEPLLRKFGISRPPASLLNDFFAAIENERQNLRQAGTDHPEIRIEEIWNQVLNIKKIDQAKAFAVEFEMIANPVFPMPHLNEMLYACRQKNISLGIISNGQFYTPLVMEWLLDCNLTDLGFDPELMIFSYQQQQAKPSLSLFRLAVAQLKKKHIPEKAVIYLGNDMLNDIYPAHTVGFNTALYAGDARSLRLRKKDPRCKNVSPDLIITELLQIPDHL